MSDEQFVKEYEKLLDKDYCNCNEMNCIDNNAPRRILNIVQKLMIKNRELDSNNKLLVQQLKDCKKENAELQQKINGAIYLIEGILQNPESFNGRDNAGNLLQILKGGEE